MDSTTTRPHDLDPPPALAAVEAWLARQPVSPGRTWCAFADPDGTIGLVPSGPDGVACPALLLTEHAGGYGVTACDPDESAELGVFTTIEDALRGIACWMVPVVTGGLGAAHMAA